MTGLLFLLALTSLSASPIFVRWSGAPIEFLGFWRLLLAGALFLAWEISRHGLQRLRSRDGGLNKFTQSQWRWPVLSGVFFFLHLWTYVASAQNTSVAHLVILYASNPIFTAAGAYFFFGEQLKKRLWIVYPIAFLGLWVLIQDKVSHSPQSGYGDLLAVASAALHAAYLLCSKQARKTFENVPFSIGLYTVAAALFAGTALVRGSSLVQSTPEAWGAIAALILFPTFLGHALMTNLVNKIDLSVLSCGKLLEPGLSTAMAYFLLQEPVSARTFLAFALTALAVLILVWPQRWTPVRRMSA
ncbi:MAG: DMT family transporter [Bdellovibrio sp.]|jgi:drug/metabolite transporter (DMT)-like permease